jgi:hypothetical protein
MMRTAGRLYGLRGLILAVVALVGVASGLEGYGHLRASALVESLKSADTAGVPPIVEQLSSYRRWADTRLFRLLKESEPTSRVHLHASLALLPVDASQAEYLFDRMLKSTPTEFSVLRDALRPYQNQLTPQLRSIVSSAKSDDARLLPSAGALARYEPSSPRGAEVSDTVAHALVSVNSVYLGDWLEALRPLRDKLTPPLASILRDPRSPEVERMQATNVLADYAGDDPDLLADLLLDSDARPFSVLFDRLKGFRERALQLMERELSEKASPEAKDDEKDRLARRQSRAAVALVRLGRTVGVWPLLRYSADPRVRSYIIDRLDPLGLKQAR